MYCPECGGEYRKGIVDCPTCEVALTEEPAAPDAHGGRNFAAQLRGAEARLAPLYVDLVQFMDETEARSARTRLREARIPCELVIRDGEGGGGGDLVEECWIRVPGAAVRVAADLLGLDQELSEDACPMCGTAFGPDGVCPRCASEHQV